MEDKKLAEIDAFKQLIELGNEEIKEGKFLTEEEFFAQIDADDIAEQEKSSNMLDNSINAIV
ncbi:hypothetical protein [Rugamonas rubra]|uniref:Uncharacterized protein n=1 Tax=Rugamonas rubra TaxID=758825 RepID=A0A1I4UA69_9BURK|nr:hypothetical protein [Rugamonas rubra]SFM85862.1 hypothetical protein SAMN02982985_05562 [Rugamonas rubra]